MSNETYIYPNHNTEYEERLRKTDHLAYIWFKLYTDEPDLPAGELCSHHMIEAVQKYIDPKWSKRDVLTLFENFCADHSRMYEMRGFKTGVAFAAHFFEAVNHPYYMDSIEAERAYEWMKKPIRLADEVKGKDNDGDTLPSEGQSIPTGNVQSE